MKSSDNNNATLNDCQSGQTTKVRSIQSSDSKLMGKLLSMGLVAGTSVTVLTRAPLGDPIKISAMGYTLSLRCSEARCVFVAP
jgi:Fe2+ transport system protein FeoA